MPYDKTKRPAFMETDSELFGERAALITPNASADQTDAAGRYYKYFTAGSAGDVTIVPMQNADADTISISVTAGQVIQGRIRRVTASTATLHGWFD